MIQSVAMNQANGFVVNTKRTLFMASLYFRLIRDYSPEENILDECNRLFYLVNDYKSLMLPGLLCRRVWNDNTVNEAVEHILEGHLKMAVESIYGKMPKWLRYIDRETMFRDAEKVVRMAELKHGVA